MNRHDSEDDALPDFDTDDAFGEWLHGHLKKKHGFETRPLPVRRRRGHAPVTPRPAALWERVQRVEDRIQADSPPSVHKRVEIVRMCEVNAFVAPGRYIYITAELMRRLPTDDAVALVVGHELAHADLGHLLEFRRRAMWKDVPAGDIAFILLYLAQRFVSSPENERDADAYGLDLALRAGYDGDKCLEAFAILDQVMMKFRGGERLVVGPDAAHRLTEDPFEEWKARAEVWLWERMTGYPALCERRTALAERLAQHRDTGRAPLLLPGSRKSSAAINTGFLARVEAIDDELDQWGMGLTALAADVADLMRLPVCRTLIAAISGTATGLDGRTAREVESALATLQETMRQTTVLLVMRERAEELRRFLSSDNPPQSALSELLDLLFGSQARSHSFDTPTVAGTGSPPVTDPPASITPRQLVEKLKGRFDDSRAVVYTVDASRARWRPEIAAFREDLALLDEACRALPLDRADALNRLAAQIDALQRRSDADPLDLKEHAGQDLRAALASAREEILARVVERRRTSG